MDNLVADFANTPEGPSTWFKLILVVIAFVFVNTISHNIRERANEKRQQRSKVHSELAPALSASSDLISRLCEILVYQKASMLAALQRPQHPDFMEVGSDQYDRVQSTAYRLLRFLALSHHFQTSTASIPLFSSLRRANYFLQRKLPTALKGGYYAAHLLTREEQETIASEVCDSAALGSINRLNIGRFSKLLRSGEIDRSVFDILIETISLNPAPISANENVDHSNENWRRLLAWSHITIYLIDFFQDLGWSPRWEEHRIMLVGVIRQWNVAEVNKKYLYSRGDLQSENYLDTFSERICWGRPLYWLERFVPNWRNLKAIYRRWIKGKALNERGKLYAATHRRKWIYSGGVRLEGKARTHSITYSETLAQIHRDTLHFLNSEGEVLIRA